MIKNFLISKKLILSFIFSLNFFLFDSNAQTSNSLSTGSSNRLSISISNTMGVRTTANATSNVEVNNEAVLILDPESKIQDSFDSSGEGISGDFVVSPNGASFDIKGLQAENNYVIGEGSYFKSTMKSLDDPITSPQIGGIGEIS